MKNVGFQKHNVTGIQFVKGITDNMISGSDILDIDFIKIMVMHLWHGMLGLSGSFYFKISTHLGFAGFHKNIPPDIISILYNNTEIKAK